MRHTLKLTLTTIICIAIALIVTRTATAIPVVYAFSGTEYTQVGDSWLSEPFSGKITIDSIPIIVSQGDGFEGTRAYWSITGFTVWANNFTFAGSGKLNLLGDSNGLSDINEPNIVGYGVTPYFSGFMTNGDCGINAHYFYHEDGTPYDVNIDSYLAELPYMITGDLWNLVVNPSNSVWLQYHDLTRTNDSVPIPESSSFVLLCIGFLVVILSGKCLNIIRRNSCKKPFCC